MLSLPSLSSFGSRHSRRRSTKSTRARRNLVRRATRRRVQLETLEDRRLLTLAPSFQFVGAGNWSLDAVGGNSTPVGAIEAQVPSGSTVEKAFLYSSLYTTSVTPSVTFDGTVYSGTDWTSLGANNTLKAWRTDVTSQVSAKIGSGSAAPFSFVVNSESPNNSIDGEVLAIVYSNPAEENRTIAFLDGFSASSGDTATFNFASPLPDPSAPGFEALMSLGIGFGFQPSSQSSTVRVNGTLVSSSAGGQDDGISSNGGLITVGGLGDNPANPADPNAGANVDPRYDDELYDVEPFLSAGDTSFRVDTLNPSSDDNIFFLGLNVTAVGFVEGNINLLPTTDTNNVGTDHTVTATVKDGDPLAPAVGVTVSFTVTSGPNAGTSGTAVTDASGEASFTYTGSGGLGTDSIIAQFTDQAGNTQTSNTVQKIWVNAPPVADANGPYVENEGTTFTLDASASSDPDGTIVLYEWDLDYDGVTFNADISTSSATTSTSFPDDVATRDIAVRVTDDGGSTDIDETALTINNLAPQLVGLAGSGSGGPIVLMGIDAEDGGPDGFHGPSSVYESVVSDILSNVTNGGSGILVVGGGKSSSDDVTRFWDDVSGDIGESVTYVNGASDISNQSFAGFAVIAVASDRPNTFSGGLTNPENDAMTARKADVASFVNAGGGLLGFSSVFLNQPYGYLGDLGSFSFNAASYSNITPTAGGTAIGITDALDVCCWHDEFISFPGFLDVLATNANTGNPAAIGGAQVVVAPTVDEGSPVSIDFSFTDPGVLDEHTVTIDWGDGSIDTFTLAIGDRGFTGTHTYQDDSSPGDGTPSNSYPVTVTVADDDGGVDTGTTTVTVNNVAPEITALNAGTVDENGVFVLEGSFTDPSTLDEHTVVIDWGDGSSETLNLPAGNRSFSIGHQYLDDGSSPGNGTASDVHTIQVTVADDDTGVDIDSTEVTVHNVDPVITGLVSSSPACGGVAEGHEVAIDGSFTDVGTLDNHTVTVDWGDGSPVASASVTESGGSGTFDATHTYTDGGVFTVTVTVTDDDTGSVTEETLMVITGAGVNNGVLYVVGTDQADQVIINSQGTGQFKVHADFIADGNFKMFDMAGVELINVILCDGDDHATIAANIDVPAIMDGGAGDDHLNGGGGSNVLLGGEGDDRLAGGSVRDVLIGGMGSDRLIASGGQDALVGDATVYDLNYQSDPLGNNSALLEILEEWNSADDIATRRDHLTGTPGGLNDGFFLKLGAGATLVEDAADDELTGGSGEDWFVLLGDDVATDLKTHQGDLENF